MLLEFPAWGPDVARHENPHMSERRRLPKQNCLPIRELLAVAAWPRTIAQLRPGEMPWHAVSMPELEVSRVQSVGIEMNRHSLFRIVVEHIRERHGIQ